MAMKIYILPVKPEFRPQSQRFRYPSHNDDYGVEQDFLDFMDAQPDLVADSPETADWHYLPVFWTRWHLNNNYGQEGLESLQTEIDRVLLDDSKTFTVCQYDDGPLATVGNTIIFLSSRKSEVGIDIPLLSSPHRRPIWKPKKKFKASFVGRLDTHPIRREMASKFGEKKDIFIYDGFKSDRFFVKTMLRSYLALAPRGYGGSSFRFFEAMELGVVPILLSDLDTRPFKKWIDWKKVSFYFNSAEELGDLSSLGSPSDLVEMARNASGIYGDMLNYQKWCPYVLQELNDVSK